MVEGDCLPITFSMALVTFISVRPFMLVIFLVTRITVHRCIFEGWCLVTLLALHIAVLAHQREARPVMVEWCLLPGPVVVALLTFRPFLPLMFVILLMTGVTVHGRLFIPVARMAVFARHLDMLMA